MAVRQGELQPPAVLGDVNDARSRAVREVLEVIRAAGRLVEGAPTSRWRPSAAERGIQPTALVRYPCN
jgi:hypothetical protein